MRKILFVIAGVVALFGLATPVSANTGNLNRYEHGDYCPRGVFANDGFVITCEDDYNCADTLAHLYDGECWWDFV